MRIPVTSHIQRVPEKRGQTLDEEARRIHSKARTRHAVLAQFILTEITLRQQPGPQSPGWLPHAVTRSTDVSLLQEGITCPWAISALLCPALAA